MHALFLSQQIRPVLGCLPHIGCFFKRADPVSSFIKSTPSAMKKSEICCFGDKPPTIAATSLYNLDASLNIFTRPRLKSRQYDRGLLTA